VVFKVDPEAKQVGPEAVQVKLKICASSPNTGTCPDLGNSGNDANDDETNVVLLGLRAPEGSELPRKIVGKQLEFRRSKQFGGVLNDEAPTPVGFDWTGYRSSPVVTNPEDTAKIKIGIGLPAGFDKPRFRYRPTVGYFTPSDERPADSPIVCGEALFDRDIGDGGARTCIDSPTPDETAAHLALALD
jgi:hypothetical protein